MALAQALPGRPSPASEEAAADDRAVLARASRGEPAAFRELFRRHHRDVARLVARMMPYGADCEDVVQEVFVQVHKSLKDFRGDAKFSTWLHRVTVNVVLMHRRAARSRPTFSGEVPASLASDHTSDAPDLQAERHERLRAFARLLDRLAEKKRTVFVLHDLEGLPPSEISSIVDAPVLTVRTRLFYARRELEEMIGEEPSLAALGVSFSGKAAP